MVETRHIRYPARTMRTCSIARPDPFIRDGTETVDKQSQIWDFSLVKPALFHPKAREQIKTFPEEVRKELGKAIFDLQKGHTLGMPLSRPMSSVALGVEELRIRDRTGIYRAFYYKQSARGVLIFHAFVKKTQKTPLQDVELGRKRLKELLDEKI